MDEENKVASDWSGEVNKAIRESKKTRQKYSKKSPVNEQTEDLGKEVDELFKPEKWEAIVRAPADLRLAITGREHWNLKREEVKTLAHTGATTAKYFLATDPKWIALSLFMFNVAVIYGQRIAIDVAMNKQQKPTTPPEDTK